MAGRRIVHRLVAAVILALSVVSSTGAQAQADEQAEPVRRTRPITSSLAVQLLWTDNVQPQSDEPKRSDFALTVTPRLFLQYQGDRAQLTGRISLPFVVYAESRSKDAAYPEANVLGKLEIVDRFFFVDAAANVRTIYHDPFGPRPADLEQIVDNRFTAQSYSVSPYIQGQITSTLRYFLRDDNLWTDLGDAPAGANARNAYTNVLTGSIDQDPTPFGWGFDISRSSYRFDDQPNRTQTLALARARASWQPGPQLRLQVSGGYEHNQFPLSTNDGAIYGVGVFWRPSDRTVLDATWEHRFFGGSYEFLFEHRMQRATFNLNASRNIRSYPEQLVSFPAGSFVPGVLDSVFASRIPDPVARREFILQFMTDQGLPLFLSDPVALFSQQVYLVESASASAGLVGVRNTLVMSVYYYKTEPVGGEELPVELVTRNRTKQVGTTVTWSNQLTPLTTFTLTGNANRAEGPPPLLDTSDSWGFQLKLTRRLSPKSTAYAGARYDSFESEFRHSYNATAVFIGASHSFE